ncbi:MAG: type I secretion system permease/ATPase [Proteobacteria bacterium]|nr:type I secretion system permease/ATPase [Pseudomonadota bacterium]MBU1685905.1 type I secretion system permease/ATPase [Pseudomonadota bacterium]
MAGNGHNQLDPLLEVLLITVRLHGGNLTREAAMAGLPLEGGRLSPTLFARAAHRGNLVTRLVHGPLASLNRNLFPVILLLSDRQACLVIDLDLGKGRVRVIYPELGEASREIPLAELEESYSGDAIYIQPRFRFDTRSPEVGKVRRRHWFWSVLGENFPLYRDVLIAAFLLSLFALAVPLFTRNVYDRVVPNQAIDTLWVLASGVLIILVGDVLLRTMRAYFLDLASKRVDVKLSAFIMERVLGTRMEYRPISTGSFASNLRSFETVRDFITSATITALIDLPFAAVFLAVIAMISWPLIIPILVGMILVVIGSLLVQSKMHELSELTYRASAQRNSTLIESLVGLETIKTMGSEGVLQGKWEKSVVYLAQIANQLRLLSTSTMNMALWVTQTINIANIVIGVYLIADHRLTMGGLIACAMLSSRAMAPISQLAGLLTQYHHATTAFHSLDEILNNPVERPDNANFVTRLSFDGAIEFKEVAFSYPGQQSEALRNISFKFNPGEHVAILGKVGSGKSTLLRLILGLYQPTGGGIFLDGIDLRQLDPAEVRRSIGYVSQDVTLFFGTMRDNLMMNTPHADDRDLIDAARVGGLLEFINAHPQGFDLIVGERGESLSGGQRQGVALARAAIKKPPILLLDEPTGSMDHSSEDLVRQELEKLSSGKTLVLVTHRTSLLSLVQRIIVVDGGKIVADGPKDSVIEALRQGRIGRAS